MDIRYYKSWQDVGQIFKFNEITKTLDRFVRWMSMTLPRSRLIIEISDLTKVVGGFPRSLTSLWYLSDLRDYFSYQNLVSTNDIRDLTFTLLDLQFFWFIKVLHVPSTSFSLPTSWRDHHDQSSLQYLEKIFKVFKITMILNGSWTSLILP